MHNKIGTDIRTAKNLVRIHETVKLDAVSFELNTKTYQPLLDKISSGLKKTHFNFPFSMAIGYAARNKVPIIATDCLEYPEYPQIVEIEREIESKYKPMLESKKPVDQSILNDFDKLLSKYYKLHYGFTRKRDKYVATALDDYIQNNAVNNMVHICGAKHIPNLKVLLNKELKYEVVSKEV